MTAVYATTGNHIKTIAQCSTQEPCARAAAFYCAMTRQTRIGIIIAYVTGAFVRQSDADVLVEYGSLGTIEKLIPDVAAFLQRVNGRVDLQQYRT